MFLFCSNGRLTYFNKVTTASLLIGGFFIVLMCLAAAWSLAGFQLINKIILVGVANIVCIAVGPNDTVIKPQYFIAQYPHRSQIMTDQY